MPTTRDDTPWHAPFWAGTARGVLSVQRCDDCATLRFPPGPVCSNCAALAHTWVELSGSGRVLSWTRTHHAFGAGLAERVPYTVVLVELDEQPDLVMYGNLLSESELAEGTPVQAVFEKDSSGDVAVNWTL